jgi:hypothetical protein
MATSMLHTGQMDDGQGNVAFYNPGYPLFLIPFFAIFGNTAEVAQFVNAALGIISILLIYLCSKEVLPSWKWAVVPALLWATYPPAILYTEYVAKENLLVPLLLLQILMLLRFPYSLHPNGLAIALGIVFGIELLVGPAVILTGTLVGLVVVGLNFGKSSLRDLHWLPFLACVFGCMITLTPWLSYTTLKLGKPILNTNGSFNLYLGNNPNSTVHFIDIEDTPIGPVWHSLRKEKGEVESMSILKHKALEYIHENPLKTIQLSLRKIVYFWTPPIHEGKYGNQSKLEKVMRLVWLFYYSGIVIFALIPFLFFRELNRSHFILYGTVFLYCAIHGIAFVIFRFRLTIMPIMCILAACSLYFAYTWWNSERQKTQVM